MAAYSSIIPSALQHMRVLPMAGALSLALCDSRPTVQHASLEADAADQHGCDSSLLEFATEMRFWGVFFSQVAKGVQQPLSADAECKRSSAFIL